MKIVIASAFRNSAKYLEQYFDRMAELQTLLNLNGHDLTLVLGYGDSQDGTGALLYEECTNRFHSHLVECSHGGYDYGSVVHPERFRQLAYVGNKLWQNLPTNADIVSLIESDLRWQPEAFLRLVEGLRSLETALVSDILLAPLIHHENGRFYDTWAFRRNGQNFKNNYPFHRDMVEPPDYLEMDSVGSVLVMRGELAHKLYWPQKDVIVGVCRLAKEHGARIFADTRVRFYHP